MTLLVQERVPLSLSPPLALPLLYAFDRLSTGAKNSDCSARHGTAPPGFSADSAGLAG